MYKLIPSLELLSLNDYPGQGTALVGVLDAFWDEKGYITAKEFKNNRLEIFYVFVRKFCSQLNL